MTTSTRRAHAPAWVLAFLAAVLAVVLGAFTVGPASALTASAAQNAVGASTPTAQVAVEPSASITAGQRLGNDPPQPRTVVATGVAAKYGDDVVEGIGDSRTYIDLTKGGSIRNVGTNATHTEFADNLAAGGWISRTSKDGAVQIFQRDGAKYVLRERAGSYGGWTADFTPAGAADVTLKVRLGYMP